MFFNFVFHGRTQFKKEMNYSLQESFIHNYTLVYQDKLFSPPPKKKKEPKITYVAR